MKLYSGFLFSGLLVSALFVAAGCAHEPTTSKSDSTATSMTQEPPAPAHPTIAELHGHKGSKAKGTIAFTDEGKDIHVVGEFWGLKKNTEHGLHVHENGSCDGKKFEGAGGHWNPQHTEHGGPNTEMRHPGDLGNVKADKKGHATIDIRIPNGSGVNAFAGKSVILHAKTDNEKSQPAGDSGDKIACGLIVEKQP